MTRLSKLNFTILLSIVLILCFSCKNKPNNEKNSLQNESKESVVSVEKQVFTTAQKQLGIFFNFLKQSDTKSGVKLFKSELLTSPGEDVLINGLTTRIATMGAPDNFKIIYDYVDYTDKSDAVYYFIIRSFNKQGGMCYERIGMETKGNDLFIGLYEYSPVPYCDVKMANDSRSEVYKSMKKLYDFLNKKEYSEAVDMVDDQVFKSKPKDFLVKNLTEELKDHKKISTFRVTSVNVILESEIIKLNLVVEVEDVDKSVFVEDLGYVDRNGILKIVNYKRREVAETTKSGNPTLSMEEYGRFTKAVESFYLSLSSNNLDAIMSKIDKSVFKNNDPNSVKNSFANRNSYYGTPQDTKITSRNVKSIDGMTLVEFYYDVSNSNGIKSYEKVTVAYYPNDEFLLYGYDYSDKELK